MTPTALYTLTTLSAVLFFGFVILGVKKFGLLSCYSAYGPKWAPEYASQINPWQLVTLGTALLLLPVLIQLAQGNPWQCTGFIVPVCLMLVSATPEYYKGGFQNVLHQIGAWGSVVFILLYVWQVPHLAPVILAYAALALILSAPNWSKWMFWAEMAMYAGTFTVIFAMIGQYLQ